MYNKYYYRAAKIKPERSRYSLVFSRYMGSYVGSTAKWGKVLRKRPHPKQKYKTKQRDEIIRIREDVHLITPTSQILQFYLPYTL